MFENTHSTVSGILVRVSALDQVNIALQRHSPNRPEARYNRHGQDALYLTPSDENARVAMRKYAKEISTPLYLARYDIDSCKLVDLRHSKNRAYREKASQNWQDAISKGNEPTSWEVSDLLRTHNEIGLIDPSRKDPEAWHVTLFRWNEVGAPTVKIVAEPTPITLKISDQVPGLHYMDYTWFSNRAVAASGMVFVELKQLHSSGSFHRNQNYSSTDSLNGHFSECSVRPTVGLSSKSLGRCFLDFGFAPKLS